MAKANTINDFVMFRPNEGGTPTQRTEVKLSMITPHYMWVPFLRFLT